MVGGVFIGELVSSMCVYKVRKFMSVRDTTKTPHHHRFGINIFPFVERHHAETNVRRKKIRRNEVEEWRPSNDLAAQARVFLPVYNMGALHGVNKCKK